MHALSTMRATSVFPIHTQTIKHTYQVHYNNRIDAYGVVKLPVGDIECLRMRSDCMDVSDPQDTVRYIEYTWISPKNIYVAKAVCPDNNPDPNFTTARYFERFKSISLPSSTNKKSAFIPTEHVVARNYPNPFNPFTFIEYSLPNSGYVYLEIFNIEGKRIKILQSGFQMAGTYKMRWDGTHESGEPVSSGIYLYRLRTHSTDVAGRMLLIR